MSFRRPVQIPPVTFEAAIIAHGLMKKPGLGLHEAAAALGVHAAELDRALWMILGRRG
jgi:hypothetical protein